MGKDLTSSVDDRQNILNTSELVKQIEESLFIQGFKWRNETVFTKQQIPQLLEISDVTIENYLNKYDKELKTNGYTLLKAEDLQEFRDLSSLDAINKNDHATLAIFTFKAFLNFGMLVTESEGAKVLRRSNLDITMDVIAKNNGGAPKYIEFSGLSGARREY